MVPLQVGEGHCHLEAEEEADLPAEAVEEHQVEEGHNPRIVKSQRSKHQRIQTEREQI